MKEIEKDIEKHRAEIEEIRNANLTLTGIYRISMLEKEIERLKVIINEPKREAGA